MKPFYIDTSAFYAYLVQNDRYHGPVATCLTSAVSEGRALFSSSLVLGEVLGLLQFRHGLQAASRFMTDVFPLVRWRWVDAPMFDSIWRLVREEQRSSLTVVDASAVVCIRERPGSVCVAVDDDLRSFEFEVLP
jgi:predicted nucleic acid-binding protein